jgi:ferredoxin--NADP+ reductase
MPYHEETVTDVHPWSARTFSLKLTRPEQFDFINGEFVTLGLRTEGKLIARAYSIVSTRDDPHLEFLSIHVPDGPLTSRLAQIRPGDKVWVNSKATGSLTLAHVQPGRHLYMLATGTGLAPFMSLVRAPETWQSFEKIILVHTVRTTAELAYREELQARAGSNFIYQPTVTREPFAFTQRCSDAFISGELFKHLGLQPADPVMDRVMLCGNPAMNRQMGDYLRQNGWIMTNHRGVGNFTVEAAFVTHQN